MAKKLFRVKVILYVMAENESEACVAATDARFDIFECTAKKADRLEPGWEDAIPYNSEDARTCAELISSTSLAIQPAGPTTTYIERWHPGVQTYSNLTSMPSAPR